MQAEFRRERFPGAVAELQEQLANAESDLQNFSRMLQRKYPDYAALEYPQPTALASIPLHPGETLVEFKMTDTSTFVWIIRSDAAKGNSLISFYKVPAQRAWFDSQISKLRDAFNSGQPEGYDPDVPEELFGKLFPGKQAAVILVVSRVEISYRWRASSTSVRDIVSASCSRKICSSECSYGLFSVLQPLFA